MPDWDLVLTAESMRALEEEATRVPYRVSLEQLMEQAGLRVAEAFSGSSPPETPVLILVGPGNNGGDALVAARYLLKSGHHVACYLHAESGKARSELNELNLRRLKTSGSVRFLETIVDFQKYASESFQNREWALVDGLYGLGFKGRIAGDAEKLLRLCQDFKPKFCLAIDVPSGLPMEGMINPVDLESVLEANLTVTFAFRKLPHVLAPFRHFCGEVKVVDIGLPKDLSQKFAQQQVPKIYHCKLGQRPLTPPFSSLSEDSHKYERGHVLVIGGSPGLSGAPIMASLAAIRAGAGWVSLALPKECQGEKAVPFDVPLAVGIWNGNNEIDIEQLAHYVEHRKVKSIVLGCGMLATKPLANELVSYFRDFIRIYNGFVILDAGALFLAESWLESFRADATLSRRLLLLPHPGEWQKMFLGERPGDFNHANGLLNVATWLKKYQIALIYKSASPVFVDPATASVYIHAFGSRVLAKAGSGDVLAGICGAFSCQLSEPLDLVQSALTYLGAAANTVVGRYGYDGNLTSDLIEALGRIQASSPK